MSVTGTVVYLHTSVDEQVRRTNRDRKRPLLQNENPARVLAELMTIREPLYREVADIVIDTDGRSPKTVAQDIAARLRQLA
jgi:shikimate kinase